jgi:O-antigen biosynthesis protein WbqV
MTRYFMSTDEAVRLVLLGAALPGDHRVLALEMGEQVNIYALAERMIRLCGLRPHQDIEITVTGLRPGEKLSESLVSPAEGHEPAHENLLLSIEPVALAPDELRLALAELWAIAERDDHLAARAALLALARPAAKPVPDPLEDPELGPTASPH